MSGRSFPSIWLGDFHSKADFDAQAADLAAAFSVFDRIDDRLLYSRHPMTMPAYCSACGKVTEMRLDWGLSGAGAGGSIHPAWTETAACAVCGLNSRMRAVIDFLKTRVDLHGVHRVYVAEQTTASYRVLKAMFADLTGSEYLGPEYKSGTVLKGWRGLRRLRHEDLTALSFSDGTFGLAITQDVFEHVPDYRKAFRELHRVLKPDGRLVFTIPFSYDLAQTRIRASLGTEGVVHHLPPEVHGNPVSHEGSLCFQNFGWDVLTDLRQAGFADAFAAMYWGPWQGHLGFPFFVFCALRGGGRI